jgi:hypothetical protein
MYLHGVQPHACQTPPGRPHFGDGSRPASIAAGLFRSNRRKQDEVSVPPDYLPPPTAKNDPFEVLYADPSLPHCCGGTTTKIKRIAPNSTFEQVYRRLPSAVDFEYFGYVTKSRIAYGVGGATSAPTVDGRDCRFHSHPTEARYADGPSPRDVYAFLEYPTRRSITVGRKFIWWWDKSEQLFELVRRLNAWEKEHMLATCSRLSRAGDFPDRYPSVALAAMGCTSSLFRRRPEQWTKHLWKTLRLETRLLEIIPQRHPRVSFVLLIRNCQENTRETSAQF